MDIFQIVRLNSIAEFYEIIRTIDIDITNHRMENLLHTAIAYNNSEIAIELLNLNINVNHKNKNGETPLHYAAAHSNKELAKKILEAGGDLSLKDRFGNNPLWTAVFNARGHYDIVQLFVDFGGDATNKNSHGKSALDFAAQIDDKALLQILQ